jgi:hypothetical protein
MQKHMQTTSNDQLESMKSSLNFLPEIRQEVQSLLKLVQGKNLSHRFKNVLSHLEKLPNDIQEVLKESDAKKLDPIWYEFELVKPVIRVEILAIRTYLALGLNDWNIGKHIIRDANGLKTGELEVINIWGANMIPSFHLPARIAVVRCDSHYRIAFGVGTSNNNVSTSIIQTQLPPDWVDPLAKTHQRLFQFEDKRVLTLDGIGYELDMISEAGRNTMEFAIPEIEANQSFVELEKAILSVAETVVNINREELGKDDLSVWQRWLAK